MSGGQRQAVAIARAAYWNAQLMIMDEPTAALGVPEQRKVLALVRTLRERGVGVIIISHNLQDVLDVADRVVVMRRGRAVGERQVADTNTSELLGLMIGASASKPPDRVWSSTRGQAAAGRSGLERARGPFALPFRGRGVEP